MNIPHKAKSICKASSMAFPPPPWAATTQRVFMSKRKQTSRKWPRVHPPGPSGFVTDGETIGGRQIAFCR